MAATSLDDALALASGLAAGELSTPVELPAMRSAHRQRFSKGLHFVSLLGPRGESIEAILRADVMGVAEVNSLYRLGDVLSVTGRLEMRSHGRASILASRLAVVERWEDAFPGVLFQFFELSAPAAVAGDASAAAESAAAASATSGAGASPSASDMPGRRVANVLLQCHATLVARLADHLARALGVGVLGVARPTAAKKHAECGLLLDAPDVRGLVAALRADRALTRTVQRVYLLQRRCATRDEAASALAELLADAAPGGPAVRVSGFPRSLELPIAERLQAAAQVEVRPTAYDAVACVAYCEGYYAVGVATRGAFGGSFWNEVSAAAREEYRARRAAGEVDGGTLVQGETAAAGEWDGGVVTCKAFHKIREVASRCTLALGAQSVAIDVGAAPGGWTAFLAASGCGRVVAIDPAQMRLDGLPAAQAAAVEHMRVKLQVALPSLVERRVAADAYLCDMNAPPSDVVNLLLTAAPVLRAGARLVLTFKNDGAKPAEWRDTVATQLMRLRAVADGVRTLQLFANTSHETTVLATWRGCSSGC